MNLLAAIKREERKLEKELGKVQGKLNGLRAAAKALGGETVREIATVQEARNVCSCESEDFEGNEGAVGKI